MCNSYYSPAWSIRKQTSHLCHSWNYLLNSKVEDKTGPKPPAWLKSGQKYCKIGMWQHILWGRKRLWADGGRVRNVNTTTHFTLGGCTCPSPSFHFPAEGTHTHTHTVPNTAGSYIIPSSPRRPWKYGNLQTMTQKRTHSLFSALPPPSPSQMWAHIHAGT